MSGATEAPNRRREKRRQTHQRIYDEAIRLFAEEGYEQVTVGRIAAAAGVSVPTFYAHYASKEALLLGLPEQAQLEGLVATQPADATVADQVRGAIRTWLRHYGAQEHWQVLERWRIVAATPSLRIRAAEYERMTARMLLEAIQRRSGDGRPSAAAEVAVTTLMAAYTQVLLRWAEDDGRCTLEAVAEEVLEELRRV